MQGKGIIKFFLVAIALVCLLQYVFYWPTSRVESNADAKAKIAAAAAPAESRDQVYQESLFLTQCPVKLFSVSLVSKVTHTMI